MDITFSSKEELFERVKPALNAKTTEMHRLGYPHVQAVDIWNYLISSKWSSCKGLMLADIVNDILHVNERKVDEYLKGKVSRTRRVDNFDNEIEYL